MSIGCFCLDARSVDQGSLLENLYELSGMPVNCQTVGIQKTWQGLPVLTHLLMEVSVV